ncbi:unnamed protein product [Urochloa humidicola]
MASSRAAFLLCLFLAAAAAAARTGRAAVVTGCEAEILGPVVGLFCSTRAPAASCCLALAHSVRRGGLGCLCRLAAESPVADDALNSTDLLRIYAECGGGGARRLASACDAGAHAPVIAPRPPPSGGRSAACVAGRILADQMELYCGGRRRRRSANAPCCEAVVASVQTLGGHDVPCFCAAARERGRSPRRRRPLRCLRRGAGRAPPGSRRHVPEAPTAQDPEDLTHG